MEELESMVRISVEEQYNLNMQAKINKQLYEGEKTEMHGFRESSACFGNYVQYVKGKFDKSSPKQKKTIVKGIKFLNRCYFFKGKYIIFF